MPDSAPEATPLLPKTDTGDEQEDHLFDELDRSCDLNKLDCPPCPKHKEVRDHLTHATLPSSNAHPAHHHMQSPALIRRLEQALQHGFGTIVQGTRSFFANKVSRVPKKRSMPSMHTVVVVVFALAVLTMLAMTAVGPTLLLYMNEVGYTSSTNVAPYVVVSSLSSSVPIASNIVLGFIASRMGPGRALAIGALFSAAGKLAVIYGRGNFISFFVGYAMYSASNSLRVIRLSILTRVVPDKERTTVLATHALMTPVGALLGPLAWIAFQTFRGKISVLGVIVDRFFLDYGFTFLVLLFISAIAWVMLHRIGDVHASEDEDAEAHSTGAEVTLREGSHTVTLHYADGHEEDVDLDVYKKKVFIYFCAIMFGVNLSAGFYMTSFQPVLVNEFHVTDAKLGFVFELIAMFSIFPPLIVAALSRYLLDRQIMVIGLGAKLIGMALFLPLFGPVREWQVIVGFMLIIKASIFFSTASMSLFTKKLGAMSTSSLLGLLASGSNVGPAVAQIAFADNIVTKFGSNSFGIFAVPAFLSLVLILFPSLWEQLNTETEYNRLLVEETRNLRSVPTR